jgi:nicotinate dehydrogenase subunit B
MSRIQKLNPDEPVPHDFESIDIFGATLTRRRFVTGVGGLVAGLSVVGAGVVAESADGAERADATEHKVTYTKIAPEGQGVPLQAGTVNSPDPTQPGAWFTINPDNTITMRTGRAEMGIGSASTAYAMIAADELYVPYSAMTEVIIGDTDLTPDGGGAFGMMSLGGASIRTVAALTYQALLALASAKFGLPVSQLSASNGVISGGGQSVTYGQLVQDPGLSFTIPVSGNNEEAADTFTGVFVLATPPLKPWTDYDVVGQSIPMRTIPGIVAATATYVGDVRLPGMLHGRSVHPKDLGSKLISVGKLSKKTYPHTQVVVQGNYVGVVDPDEWTAITAAQELATKTKWSDWSGLPTSANLFSYMRTMDWGVGPVQYGASTKVAAVREAKTTAEETHVPGTAQTLSESYYFPVAKHAPIGPSCSVADVRSDGTVWLHIHNQNPSMCRYVIAQMLNTSIDNVTVRWYDGSGQYGRGNGGTTGSEEEAVILSKAVGKPVRLQWMRPDDMQWSTQHAPVISDIQGDLDASGNLLSFQANFYQPGQQDDRPIGALLAGLPTMPAPGPTDTLFDQNTADGVIDTWVYDKVPTAQQAGYQSYQLGQTTPADPTFNTQVGLRTHSMRTPGQRQQNFAQESMMSELAAAAGIDPIQFRLNNTSDPQLTAVLNTLRSSTSWQSRPSPSPQAASASAGSTQEFIGQGCSQMLRSGAYWACVVHVSVVPKTGKVRVLDLTTVADPGLVVNPRQLQRMAEGGAVMGTSEALHEAVAFNTGAITDDNWVTFPILRFEELPKIKIIIAANPTAANGQPGGGGEGPNGFAAAAIANAIFDAVGKQPREVPFVPSRIKALFT